jgi:multidrug resistance protein, MATE family
MMGWIGATALAAHQIALSCAAFTFMLPLGLSIAVSMRLARAVGEGRHDLLRPIAYGAHLMSAIVMGGTATLFIVGGTRLAEGFVQDPAVIELAARLLVVAAVFQLFDGAQVVGVSALRGLADVKVPTVITAIAYWGIALPAAYWFGVRGVGAIGIWSALATGLAAAAVLLAWRFHRLTAMR